MIAHINITLTQRQPSKLSHKLTLLSAPLLALLSSAALAQAPSRPASPEPTAPKTGPKIEPKMGLKVTQRHPSEPSEPSSAPPTSPRAAVMSFAEERAAYERFFKSSEELDDADEGLLTELFAQDFLRVVPVAQLREIKAMYLKQLGAYQAMEPQEGGGFTLLFARGRASSRLSLYQGKVISLWFGPPTPVGDQRDELNKELKGLQGVTSALIMAEGGEVLFEHNANLPLSVGSAFKLYVLKALLSEVEAGRRHLSDVVRLKDHVRSLPSGLLQSWPTNSPLTLATLAALMISKSDNTATDLLIYELGRELIEQGAPEGMRPFLTTREAFLLKWGDHLEQRERFKEGKEQEQRAVLKELASAHLADLTPSVSPTEIEHVEWRASARELCEVMWSLRESDYMSINPGLVDLKASSWSRVVFKGGSEPGVLNYTHLLISDAEGDQPKHQRCVVATINDPERPIDEPAFTSFTLHLLAQAAQASPPPPKETSSAQAPTLQPKATTQEVETSQGGAEPEAP